MEVLPVLLRARAAPVARAGCKVAAVRCRVLGEGRVARGREDKPAACARNCPVQSESIRPGEGNRVPAGIGTTL